MILSVNNSKIKALQDRTGIRAASFDLPAGHTCPAAVVCKSKCVIQDGHAKIIDYGIVRCYAASTEALYNRTRELRERNLTLTNDPRFVDIITGELNRLNIGILRVHSSGDFYSRKYLYSWLEIFRKNPGVKFFLYSKMLPFIKIIHDEKLYNVGYVYSLGGRYDGEYGDDKSKIPASVIVGKDGLPVITLSRPNRRLQHKINTAMNNIICDDPLSVYDDYTAMFQGESFGIKLHGTQPKKAR